MNKYFYIKIKLGFFTILVLLALIVYSKGNDSVVTSLLKENIYLIKQLEVKDSITNSNNYRLSTKVEFVEKRIDDLKWCAGLLVTLLLIIAGIGYSKAKSTAKETAEEEFEKKFADYHERIKKTEADAKELLEKIASHEKTAKELRDKMDGDSKTNVPDIIEKRKNFKTAIELYIATKNLRK